MAEEQPGFGWYLIVASFFFALTLLSRVLLQPANDPSLVGFFLNLLLLGLTFSWALSDVIDSSGHLDRFDFLSIAALLGVVLGLILVSLWIPWN
jgi:hypothetical protein